MSALNPQTLKDQDRYIGLKTDFAKTRFWLLKERLGHKYWAQIRRIVEDNLNNGKPCRHAFAIVSDVRKSEQERWQRTQPQRMQELREFAIQLAQQDTQRRHVNETPIIQEGNVTHVTFGRRPN